MNNASPLYDRQAIARSMAEGAIESRHYEEELDTTYDDESDITMPDQSSWPSSRRSFIAGDLGHGSVNPETGLSKLNETQELCRTAEES